jgi:hypothetical protein
MPDLAAGDVFVVDDLLDQVAGIDDRTTDLEATVGPLVPIVYDVPRGEIGYTEMVSDELLATDTSGEVDLWGVATNVLPDRKIRVSATGRATGKSGDTLILRLTSVNAAGELGAGEIARAEITFLADDAIYPFHMTRTLAGDATGLAEGSQTFRVTAELAFGSGPAGVRASNNAPMTMMVDDQGTAV